MGRLTDFEEACYGLAEAWNGLAEAHYNLASPYWLNNVVSLHQAAVLQSSKMKIEPAC